MVIDNGSKKFVTHYIFEVWLLRMISEISKTWRHRPISENLLAFRHSFSEFSFSNQGPAKTPPIHKKKRMHITWPDSIQKLLRSNFLRKRTSLNSSSERWRGGLMITRGDDPQG